jgi:hypothetical protein
MNGLMYQVEGSFIEVILLIHPPVELTEFRPSVSTVQTRRDNVLIPRLIKPYL